MKKLLSILILASVFLTSCEGPQGPPGEDGVYVVGQTFETSVDFTPANDFQVIVDIPSNVEVLESDIILTYLLEEVDGETGADVWTLLPQTFYLDGGGEFQYSYNHTSFDVKLFLQGNVDLNTLSQAATDNQIFRMVVVPSDFALNSGVDIYNYDAVKAAMNISDSDVQKTQVKK